MTATTDLAPVRTFSSAVPNRASRVIEVRVDASLPTGACRRYVAYAGAADAWRAVFRRRIREGAGSASAFRCASLVVPSRLRTTERATYEAAGAEVLDGGMARLLPKQELEEVLRSGERDELAIGVTVDTATDAVVVYRGSLDRLVVPSEWFRSRARGREDVAGRFDLEAARPTDYGQTLQFGAFEVSVGALLYEFDADVRRRQRERARDESSFGASVRRLRLQRGLRQEDVPGLSRREVGRIERGEVGSPRAETLERLAAAYGVSVDALGSY